MRGQGCVRSSTRDTRVPVAVDDVRRPSPSSGRWRGCPRPFGSVPPPLTKKPCFPGEEVGQRVAGGVLGPRCLTGIHRFSAQRGEQARRRPRDEVRAPGRGRSNGAGYIGRSASLFRRTPGASFLAMRSRFGGGPPTASTALLRAPTMAIPSSSVSASSSSSSSSSHTPSSGALGAKEAVTALPEALHSLETLIEAHALADLVDPLRSLRARHAGLTAGLKTLRRQLSTVRFDTSYGWGLLSEGYGGEVAIERGRDSMPSADLLGHFTVRRVAAIRDRRTAPERGCGATRRRAEGSRGGGRLAGRVTEGRARQARGGDSDLCAASPGCGGHHGCGGEDRRGARAARPSAGRGGGLARDDRARPSATRRRGGGRAHAAAPEWGCRCGRWGCTDARLDRKASALPARFARRRGRVGTTVAGGRGAAPAGRGATSTRGGERVRRAMGQVRQLVS